MSLQKYVKFVVRIHSLDAKLLRTILFADVPQVIKKLVDRSTKFLMRSPFQELSDSGL